MLNVLFDYILASGILLLVCLWLLFRPPPSPAPPSMLDDAEPEPPYRDTQPFRIPSIMYPTCRMFSPHGDHAAYEAERAGTAALLEDALTGKRARWEADVSGARIHCYRN